MSDLFEEPDNATPLAPEQRDALIPAHITYRRELNEAEQENIYRAQNWALATRRELLTEKFVKDLHGRMLGDVWRWAGKFRKRIWVMDTIVTKLKPWDPLADWPNRRNAVPSYALPPHPVRTPITFRTIPSPPPRTA